LNVNKRLIAVAGALVLTLAAVSPAPAVIEALIPLEDLIQKQSQLIFTTKVDKIDPDKPGVVLEVGDALKGKVPFTRLPINLTGDDYAKKNKHTPQFLKRLAPKLPVVVFVVKRDKKYIGLGYTNGTWFQMTAEEGGDNPVWSFTHCEPYLRRTFKGTTAEMKETVADSVAGKKAAPKPDANEKAGLGPEVEEKKEEKKPDNPSAAHGGASGGPLFAVVPTVAIGGLVSLLAMLFPAVFGGLTGQVRRWAAMIAVVSINSTLLFVHAWLAPRWSGKWWATPLGLWVMISVVTALGMLWAWVRQVQVMSNGHSPAENKSADGDSPGNSTAPTLPTRYEQIVLMILSGLGVAMFGVCLLCNFNLLMLPWSFVLVLWIGFWAATLYVVWVRRRANGPKTPAPLTSEGIILWAMIPACLALGCAAAPGLGPTEGVGGGVPNDESRHTAHFLKATPINFAPGVLGTICSQPLIHGERIYLSVAYPPNAFGTPGNLYCLERSTGKIQCDFNAANSQEMKEGFSSPYLFDGRLYIGEGWHQDKECNLYSLDPNTLKLHWSHATKSHTESSPFVLNGKVYCGAGDDGLVCLDATKNGEQLWQYRGGHIDCPPTVVGQRVYCGVGVDRDVEGPQDTAIFCLDAEASPAKEIWRVKSNLPAWGKPFVAGDQAIFPLGNGDLFTAVKPPDRPAGAMLCVSAADGKEQWRFDVGDGVLTGPAVDQERVYFASRDGFCYCVGRYDGKLRWKHDMGSPVVVSPALAACSHCGSTNSVYAVARDGRVCCLDPNTGKVMWQRDFPATLLASPPVVTVEATPQGDHRSVYFGAGIGGINQMMVLYCLEDEWKEK
jgi:outer membrane protein assembly factor BamB